MAEKTKVAIIGTNGLPARYGGFETLTNYLVEYFNEFDITVYCSKTPKENRLTNFRGAKLKYYPLKANGWQSILYDFISIFDAYIKSDNLIILGFSGAFAFPFNKLFRKNIIFNIGGIEWKKVRGSKWSSKIEIAVKKWMERVCVKNSQTVIIDNISFFDYVKDSYNITPVLAEYGGDHVKHYPVTEEILSKYSFINNPYDLTVSRAQYDMNIHLVIEAYKSIPGRTIVIVSNWNISSYGINLYEQNHNKYPNIILLNAIYDQLELDTLRSNCKLYLHTHSLCGTAPSLVEAMYLNLPIISYDVAANRATTENKAHYFKNADELVELLTNISNEEIEHNRKQMKIIADNRYRWERITGIYKENIH